jgi:protoporphyrinogen oxidase
MNIAVVGGGLTGLSAGYELSKAGHKVVIFEKEERLGGQAGTFEIGGERLEVFYHHIFTNDVDIISLLEELELDHRLEWIPSKVGIFNKGSIFNFVSPLDLLRFSPLPIWDRLRLGLLSLHLQQSRNWHRFEGITAEEWITRYAGQKIYDAVWGPLLRGKFGTSHSEVGMVWFWGKMRLRFGSRGRAMQRESLGYLNGSFGALTGALAEKIESNGGEVRLEASIRRIVTDEKRVTGVLVGRKRTPEPFDAVVATVPSFSFLKMAPDLPDDYSERLKAARYQGAACLVLTLNRPLLDDIYWLNIADPSIPFVAAIEHTNFISPSRYGDKHIVYLSNYLSAGSRLYRMKAEELLEHYIPHLRKLNPIFHQSWVEEVHLFRDDSAQPIVTTNYSERIPSMETPISNLYLANTTQIYPEDRGMNYSVRLGRQVAELVTDKR